MTARQPSPPNPLLDFSGLPRFDDIRPEHVGAGRRRAARRRRGGARARHQRRRAGRLRRAVGRAGRRHRAARARLGQRQPPQRRGRHAGAARRVHREPAARSSTSTPGSAPTSACTPSTRRWPPTRARPSCPRRAARRWPTRCATSCSSGAELRRRRESALRRDPGPPGRLRARSSPSTCSTRPTASPTTPPKPNSPACPPTSQAAMRAGAQAAGRDGYKLTLHIPSYLPVMQYGQRPRAARAALPRLRHPGQRVRPRRARQRRADARAARRCARRRRCCSATATTPRCRWCRRWPTSPQQVSDFLRDLARRARPGAERDLAELREFAAAELGLADPAALGPAVRGRSA